MTTDVRNQDVMNTGVMGKCLNLHVNSSLPLSDERELEECFWLLPCLLFYNSRIIFPPLT